MKFFVGLHQPGDAGKFSRAFISVHRLQRRRKAFAGHCEWIMDSGAFSTIMKHGGYPGSVQEYAAHIRRFRNEGKLLAAVSQDYMCEAHMIEKTGLSVAEHQRLTIERYDALLAEDTGVYIMPVLQGYKPAEYVAHIRAYGARLAHGAWVGVGSVCKRNGDPSAIEAVLSAILAERPDLRLHGFGIKLTALNSDFVMRSLFSADSMAWSFSARKQGRNGNDWREAQRFAEKIERIRPQMSLELGYECSNNS